MKWIINKLFKPQKAISDLRADDMWAAKEAERNGYVSKPFIRILYSRHISFNVSDQVAQWLYEIFKDSNKYKDVKIDNIDNAGPFKSLIHNDIASPNCMLIIVLAKDSFEFDKDNGHPNFFQEIVKCTEFLKDKFDMVVPVGLLRSVEEGAFNDLKNSLSSSIDAYHGRGHSFSEGIVTHLFNQNTVRIVEPEGEEVIDLQLREAYKYKLIRKLKKINLLS